MFDSVLNILNIRKTFLKRYKKVPFPENKESIFEKI